MESPFHSLTPFLTLFCNCQFRGLDPIQFQDHIPAGWRLETRLFTRLLCLVVKSKSHCDWRLVSQSVSLGVIFITFWQLWSCFSGAPSLDERTGLSFYMLLAVASVVFLGSEFLSTRDHILLPQIWDFPFRRLLRLAGSRWRYSTPPPHGCCRVFCVIL
jgi:hypothetical protein